MTDDTKKPTEGAHNQVAGPEAYAIARMAHTMMVHAHNNTGLPTVVIASIAMTVIIDCCRIEHGQVVMDDVETFVKALRDRPLSLVDPSLVGQRPN